MTDSDIENPSDSESEETGDEVEDYWRRYKRRNWGISRNYERYEAGPIY